MSGATKAIAAVALVALVGGGIVAAGMLTTQSAGGSEPTASPAPQTTTAVTRQTLEITDELDGMLGYDATVDVLNQVSGILTRQPDTGTVIERGQVLYEVDGRTRPALLYGARPAWRTMEDGITNGADVRQLEANLADLGFLDADEVDRVWDDDTTDAVEAWQEDAGLGVDGVLDLGEVVFLPGPVRVTELPADLGTRVGPGQAVIRGTGESRVVDVALPADDADLLAEGDTVSVELPDDSTVDGTVTSVGRIATTAADGSSTLPVTIGLAEGVGDDSAWDRAPVTVVVIRDRREDVLTVPVLALVALREGGYAVEVDDGSGATHLVGVELGLFDDGRVEVRSDQLSDGDLVVVPS